LKKKENLKKAGRPHGNRDPRIKRGARDGYRRNKEILHMKRSVFLRKGSTPKKREKEEGRGGEKGRRGNLKK